MREKTRLNQFPLILSFVTTIFLIGVNGTLYADYVTFELFPGSTFTPKVGDQITGPAEGLTGSFVWHDEGSEDGYNIFKTTSLHFESDSYTLDLSPNNNTAFLVYSDGEALFEAAVDVTGRPITEGILSGFGGTYSGPYTSPTYLYYSNIDLFPAGDGLYYGALTLYAQQVPEPATVLLLVLGGLALRRRVG
jgi:hypothetical protein